MGGKVILIPSQIANQIRDKETLLFFKDSLSLAAKRKIFFYLIRPLLDWLFDRIKENYNLEDNEIESELFIYSCKLFHSFDKSKSSIVPYLQKYIIFYAQKLETKLNKSTLNKETLVCKEKFTFLNDDFILLNILFESRFEGRYFTNKEKYIINRILELEDSKISRINIAKSLKINIKTCNKLLDNLKEKVCKLYQKESDLKM